MYGQYGSYKHPVGELFFTSIVRTPILLANGFMVGVEELWSLSGVLQGANSDQASTDAAMRVLRAAYAVNGLDMVFYLDSGLPSNLALAGYTRLGGVVVSKQPSFRYRPAAMSTFVDYDIEIKGRYELSGFNLASKLINFTETITFTGNGGPAFSIMEPLTGLPLRVNAKEHTKCTARQSGSATGILGYPRPAAPIWPGAIKEDLIGLDYTTPERIDSGFGNPVYWKYRVGWDFPFEDIAPFTGFPNLWKD